MRTGSSGTVAVLAGALSLGVLCAPPAQAADTGIEVTNMVVNGGRTIIVGPTVTQRPKFSFHVTLPRGVSFDDVDVHPVVHRYDTTPARAYERSAEIPWSGVNCGYAPSGGYDCKGDFYLDRSFLDSNGDATTWKFAVIAKLWEGSELKKEEFLTGLGYIRLKRDARVTVNASPEPVIKGRPITVIGKIIRADWALNKYTNYAGKQATLQFRKAGTNTYTVVRTVTANATGDLRAAVTASVDGYWRWSVGGTATTAGAGSTADYVDVR
ncbi:hypothetical protein RKD23_000051 [Streptomyces sp. SAI-170]|uniref:hypothetical protein n=1 Tax=Streptomyces sp. SAI-170 TaxID=3377729 RepID=UPI003C7DA186